MLLNISLSTARKLSRFEDIIDYYPTQFHVNNRYMKLESPETYFKVNSSNVCVIKIMNKLSWSFPASKNFCKYVSDHEKWIYHNSNFPLLIMNTNEFQCIFLTNHAKLKRNDIIMYSGGFEYRVCLYLGKGLFLSKIKEEKGLFVQSFSQITKSNKWKDIKITVYRPLGIIRNEHHPEYKQNILRFNWMTNPTMVLLD
jgi:hypothetical protein